MKCCNNKRNGRSCVSTSATFASSFLDSGVHNLDPNLTINSITVDPTLRYIGGMANGSGLWLPHKYGETLSITGAGTAPTPNQGSPLLGPDDDSVLFNSGKYFQAGNNTFADVTTEDFVFELLFRARTGANIRLLDKRGAGAGWTALLDTSTNLQIFGSDGTNTVLLIEPLVNGVWYHVLVFADRSGSAICYINGIAGTAVSIAAVTTLAKDTTLTIGALSTGGNAYTSNLAYFAMWKRQTWLDTHLQATVAAERFQKLIGIYPQIAKGTATPTAATRASAAYLDKVESDGTRKLYYVGANWLRCCSRNDANDVNVKGYLSEPAATNLCLQSTGFTNTIWLKTNSTISGSQVTAPDGVLTGSYLNEDSTPASTHFIAQTINQTNAFKYVVSCWVSGSNRSWIQLENDVQPNATAYFNVSGTGSVGTSANAVEKGIESWTNGWKRCWMSFTSTATTGSIKRIYVGEANNDRTFDGLNQSSVALYGFQVEASVDYPSSYIPTTTAAATRTADALRYKGDDGNLGGVGSNQKGTLVCDVLLPNANASADNYIYSLSDGGSASDAIILKTDSSDVPVLIGASTADGTHVSGSGNTDLWSNIKYNLKTTWQTNDYALFVSGSSSITDTSVPNPPDDIDRIDVGANRSSTQQTSGLIANLKAYGKPT